VRRNFDNVFGGVGTRPLKKRGNYFIDALSALLVYELAEYCTSGFKGVFQTK